MPSLDQSKIKIQYESEEQVKAKLTVIAYLMWLVNPKLPLTDTVDTVMNLVSIAAIQKIVVESPVHVTTFDRGLSYPYVVSIFENCKIPNELKIVFHEIALILIRSPEARMQLSADLVNHTVELKVF